MDMAAETAESSSDAVCGAADEVPESGTSPMLLLMWPLVLLLEVLEARLLWLWLWTGGWVLMLERWLGVLVWLTVRQR